MKQRCKNPKAAKYKLYGGKGVSVCSQWEDYINFDEWSRSNGYKDDLTLDRINGNGDYSPENCRWATHSEQALNTTQNRLITFENETRPLAEWARIKNISYSVLSSRITEYGWGVEKALTTPVGRYKK